MRLRSSVPFSDAFIISMNWGVRMYSSQVSASTFSIPPRILRISSEGGELGETETRLVHVIAHSGIFLKLLL
jgi:hypothetical protein